VLNFLTTTTPTESMCSSATPPDQWEHSFPNRLPDLMRAIDAFIEFLESHDAPPRTVYLARLAAEEFGTNIIKYGYDDAAEHPITLRGMAEADHFQLTLIDDGHEFDPTRRAHPSTDLSLEDRTPGGWGISLVRRLALWVRYERREGSNVLTVAIDRRPDST
jgi:anti-sigma regulatory factor (Ser/Thr protein kinase)